jgi:hypothetical protein
VCSNFVPRQQLSHTFPQLLAGLLKAPMGGNTPGRQSETDRAFLLDHICDHLPDTVVRG